jgi:hypothetical protein
MKKPASAGFLRLTTDPLPASPFKKGGASASAKKSADCTFF